MKDIIVKEAAGKILKVTQPMGSDGVYHIYVDAWYQGQVVRQEGQLRVYLNANSKLTERHKAMIIEAIKSAEKP